MSTPPPRTDWELVQDFWNEYVDGFIFNDLNGSIKMGANYLVALGEMCYIDYFGKLMRGMEGSEKNFKAFVIKYMGQYSGIIDPLYGEVRSGLVHAYFPKNVNLIGQSWTTPGSAIRLDKGTWTIAVTDLMQEFRAAAMSFKSDLLRGVHITEFKKVITADPGLPRIPSSPRIGRVTAVSAPSSSVSSSKVNPSP